MPNLAKTALLILALSTASTAFAQDPAPQQAPPAPAVAAHKQPNPVHQTKELAKKLGLSPDQSAQIEPILADRDQREQTLMANTTLDPKSMRQQRRAIMRDTQQKLSAILTPSQQQQFAALKQEKRNHVAPTPPPIA